MKKPRIKLINQLRINAPNQVIEMKNSKRENAYAMRCTYSKNVSTSSRQQENPNEKKTSKHLMRQDKEF
jgi:hypothetical protein